MAAETTGTAVDPILTAPAEHGPLTVRELVERGVASTSIGAWG